ncbi:major facilitator superfamily domain-containing protein [Hygrophoropsis aurantiaca]|uniref:Major facilitator superfamily domain-containing protein n=1 Tax=Hygrophoropsis aurantiaca TaxID=72124 RepID=A0ACB8AIL4_9AGAM|nr:major facilitator superfamily domain-containing protein [Hygrophoropsis aurantiaca]
MAESDQKPDVIGVVSVNQPTPQDAPPPPDQKSVERPYSIYTRSEKWLIVAIASAAGVFSPLTANIYLPAIPTMANAFHKSIELINLTVTVYLVLQGVSPMIWGTLADRTGRRPIFLACLLTLCLACIGIALTPTSDYWLLLLLRCLQAAGSASTTVLGTGVIADIATPAERGGFFGLYSLGPMVGPAIGPVLGGVLVNGLGWRSIFWFLCITSAVCLICMVAFLPETLRRLVGDGSVIPKGIYRPLVPLVGRGRQDASASRPPGRPFINPLRLFMELDVVCLLIFTAVIYAVFTGITTTISSLFVEAYPFLDETDIGLCYLAIGGGMLFGSLTTGKLLDRDYRQMKEQIMNRAEADPEKRLTPEEAVKEEHFPIEKVRLRRIPIYIGIFVVCCAGYGWCLEKRANLAAPLVLQIIFGYVGIASLNSMQTLIIDLVPTQGSSASACNNVTRCSAGALLVSVIDLIINAMGVGWTYVLLAGISLLFLPTAWLLIWLGPRCRAKRRARNARS